MDSMRNELSLMFNWPHDWTFQEHGFLSWQASTFHKVLFAARSATFPAESRSAASQIDRVVVQEILRSWIWEIEQCEALTG